MVWRVRARLGLRINAAATVANIENAVRSASVVAANSLTCALIPAKADPSVICRCASATCANISARVSHRPPRALSRAANASGKYTICARRARGSNASRHPHEPHSHSRPLRSSVACPQRGHVSSGSVLQFTVAQALLAIRSAGGRGSEWDAFDGRSPRDRRYRHL